MGEDFRGDASVLEDASLLRPKELTLVESYLEEAPFEDFCGYIVMGSAATSIGHTNPICTEPLNLKTISSPFTSHHPILCSCIHESLGDITRPHASFGPYCAYPEDVSRKIIWNPFFDDAFDISMAFNKLKRHLDLCASSFHVFSYLCHSKMHDITYDKLLRALTSSESRT